MSSYGNDTHKNNDDNNNNSNIFKTRETRTHTHIHAHTHTHAHAYIGARTLLTVVSLRFFCGRSFDAGIYGTCNTLTQVGTLRNDRFFSSPLPSPARAVHL